MKWLRQTAWLVIACVSMATQIALASDIGPNVPFSAQAVQKAPGEDPHSAEMHVSDNKVRMEYSRNGNRMIEIIDLDAGKSYLLFPSQQQYMMQQAPPQLREMVTQSSGQANPCMGNPEAKCRQLGTETVFGRKTVKWEMVVEREGQTLRTLLWIDTQRQMPLRQLWPDGTVIELSPQGMATLQGRQTEKWEMNVMQPNGETMTSQQWYDPELKIIIRDEMPGGYLRELRNIEVGSQDPSLFQVPDNYQQVKPPSNPPSNMQGGTPR